MKQTSLMEVETPLRPRAVAEAVWEEASVWLDEPLPRRWLRELIAEANTVYARNAVFRRRLRGAGNTGRDHLWMFARHWLAALIQARRPHLYARLPRSYAAGDPLPDKPVSVRCKLARHFERRRCSGATPIAERAWAAAAHFPPE